MYHYYHQRVNGLAGWQFMSSYDKSKIGKWYKICRNLKEKNRQISKKDNSIDNNNNRK